MSSSRGTSAVLARDSAIPSVTVKVPLPKGIKAPATTTTKTKGQ
jgi:hypothetical protein